MWLSYQNCVDVPNYTHIVKITPSTCSHAGRLEDKSANVRKAALQLLATLLLNNPFGPQLPADKFTVTLEDHKKQLKV